MMHWIYRYKQISLQLTCRHATSQLSSKVDKAHERVIWACTWSPCGNYFATASRDKTVKIWSTDTRPVVALPKFPEGATSIDWAIIKVRSFGQKFLPSICGKKYNSEALPDFAGTSASIRSVCVVCGMCILSRHSGIL